MESNIPATKTLKPISAVLSEIAKRLLDIEFELPMHDPIRSKLHDQHIMVPAIASRVRQELGG